MGFVVMLTFLVLSQPAQAEPGPAHQGIKAVGARASTAMQPWKGYTFGAENLIDGKVDTSWQPDIKKVKDTLGVGQWVEIDLGATYDITRYEIDLGLQKVDPALGDLFCRNTRPSEAYLIFDDGAMAWLTSIDPNARRVTSADYPLTLRGQGVARTRTRFVRLVIAQVHEAVDWKDVAVAELRVFGTPVRSGEAVATADGGGCGSPGFVPFTRGLVDHCATLGRKARDKTLCNDILNDFLLCNSHVGETPDGVGRREDLPAIKRVGPTDDTVDYVYRSFPDTTVTLTFKRVDGAWSVMDITRKSPRKVSLWEDLELRDGSFSNQCWEALGKERPYELDLP